ncbi:MAG: LamG domain-containing protein, partial [Gammaproteobacteria bacterium]|nr:LamG domain-containing protein [Gammaproteobacteria bacterium]
ASTNFFDDLSGVARAEVGAYELSGTMYDEFNGLIDDFRVYDRALSAGDVDELFAASNPLVVDTTADVADGDTSSISALLVSKGADGDISLREAIEAANNTTGADTISFDITDPLVGGAHTISLLSALDDITETVIIDGTTDADFSTMPIIVLDGSSAGADVDGLTLAAGSDGSTIRGLVINQFSKSGILVYSDGNTIEG